MKDLRIPWVLFVVVAGSQGTQEVLPEAKQLCKVASVKTTIFRICHLKKLFYLVFLHLSCSIWDL